MRATQHHSNTRVIGAPKGVSQEDLPCRAIAVTDMVYAGVQSVASVWELSDEERELIAAGGKVVLIFPGGTIVPAALEVTP